MNEQVKGKATKEDDGKTYIAAGADDYLKIVHGDYEKLAKELEDFKIQSANDKKHFVEENQRVIAKVEKLIDEVGQQPNKAVQQPDEEIDESKTKKRNKDSVISDIIFYATLVSMVIFAVLFSRGAFGNQAIGGFRFYEVLTTSMDSVYPRGSLILIKEVDAGELAVGDDITFTKDSSDLVTHRIVEIKENYEGSGSRAFVTRGVDNAVPDEAVVLADSVVGKVVKGFPRLGAMLSWLGSNLWIVLVFFLLLMALSFFIKIFWREQKKIKQEKSAKKQMQEDENQSKKA